MNESTERDGGATTSDSGTWENSMTYPDPSCASSQAAKAAGSDNTTINDLRNELQALVQEVQGQRKKDFDTFKKLKTSLTNKVSQLCDNFNSVMVARHKASNDVFRARMEKLVRVLEEVHQLEVELAASQKILTSLLQ